MKDFYLVKVQINFVKIPTMNWKHVVKELDHTGFFVRDRQALNLLIVALRRVIPTELYIDLLYSLWQNLEGQVGHDPPK